jgi:hypothetical protein
MHTLRSELIRIWRPAFHAGIGVMALFAALVSVFILRPPRTRRLLRLRPERALPPSRSPRSQARAASSLRCRP